MSLVHAVKPDHRVRLADIDPGHTHGVSKEDANERSVQLGEQLTRAQEILFAAAESSILIVLQGLDTAGKDGTINHVMTHFNPAGCRVENFRVPTPIEQAHDFLWRAHRVTPAKGSIAIFNRSYYEDVLVTRVHKLVPRQVWEGRYRHINDFEGLLTECGTTILKFFLYVSKEEQRERLEARQHNPDKAWKLSPSDWPEHDLYDRYIDAYEDMLCRCSTDIAPWYVVPSNHKWFRNLVVAQTIVDRLEPDVSEWEKELRRRGRANLELIAQKTGGAAG